jgi:hypothetical protein
MGERGRQAVRARFTWPSQAANLLALYREMLGPSRAWRAAGSGPGHHGV